MNSGNEAMIGERRLEAALEQAAGLLRGGDLAGAERACRAALDADAESRDALRLLSRVELRRGRFAEAEALAARWLRLAPASAMAHAATAAALQGMQRHEAALAAYDRALAFDPGLVAALYNRGVALQALGRPDAALDSYDRALLVRPRYGDALMNRATLLRSLKRLDEALAGWDAALAALPNHVGALLGRAAVLRLLFRPEEALACYDACVASAPDSIEALNNRGIVLQDLNRHPEALASFDAALALRPGHPELLNNRGVVLHGLGRHEEALACFAAGLVTDPGQTRLLRSRATTLAALGRYDEAAADLEGVLDGDDDQLAIRSALLHARMIECDWSTIGEQQARLAEGIRAGRAAGAPFTVLTWSDSPADQLRHARAHVAEFRALAATPVWRGERYDHPRIRLAYLSPDFDDHAVSHLVARLIEGHDRERFDTVGIALGGRHDAMRDRLERAFGRFVDVGRMSDREAALLLRELEIDIAVDLAGFTGSSRPGILAQRPAPVQVNYLGYPGTLGADWIDFIIADRVVIPAADRQHYAEAVVHLPDSYLPGDPAWPIAEPGPTRAEAGLPEAGFVFCSFNNHYKINPAMFDIWMRLLGRVGDAVLWLSGGSGTVMANLQREAAARGIAPDRLVFAPRVPLADHFARHRLADLFLDTLPFGAHSTAVNALWAGLPVLTCRGTSFAGRVAASLLEAVGLPELVARSPADYEALAGALAGERPALAMVRAKLARQRQTAPLFDADRFRRHIEDAYRTMWLRQRSGEAPAGFAVAPSA